MLYHEALTRSDIKTVRVSSRGLIWFKEDYPQVVTPIIIKDNGDGTARACYTDAKNQFKRFNVTVEGYTRILQAIKDYNLYCKPMYSYN